MCAMPGALKDIDKETAGPLLHLPGDRVVASRFVTEWVGSRTRAAGMKEVRKVK